MDALKHLIANIPDWLKRLKELNGQAEKGAGTARGAEHASDTLAPEQGLGRACTSSFEHAFGELSSLEKRGALRI